ncbi:MAG TPA: hypothetical protein VHC19_10745 [Pirellulales bacterium]|nr:hypothetical protein [Pirellulales bacterium]
MIVVVCSMMGGALLHLARPATSFVEAFALWTGLMTLPLLLHYLYWKHLRQDWGRKSSEARLFENGVFFHHKFIDWSENPEAGVLVTLEAEEQPIATLSVKMRNGDAKLAPHLRELSIPVPQDQIDQTRRLARTLCQNVNLDEADA